MAATARMATAERTTTERSATASTRQRRHASAAGWASEGVVAAAVETTGAATEWPDGVARSPAAIVVAIGLVIASATIANPATVRNDATG
jgi:L,D-peptidoglycan transpeptidase YkuD (ErfK/YbiS/YcfS/YnhG family)